MSTDSSTQTVISRLSNLSVCQKCIVLFIEGNSVTSRLINMSDDEIMNYLQTIAPSIHQKSFQHEINKEHSSSSSIWNQESIITEKILNHSTLCPCCCNTLDLDMMKYISDEVIERVQHLLPNKESESKTLTISIDLTLPPIFDLLKAIYRVISTQNMWKLISFPCYHEISKSFIRHHVNIKSNGMIIIADQSGEAMYQIQIRGSIIRQSFICQSLLGSFFLPKNKRDQNGELIDVDITKVEVDRYLRIVKSFTPKEIQQTYIRAEEYKNYCSNHNFSCCKWKITTVRCPSYLLGRYRKLSRDVPQSSWFVNEERVGRCSVEEIIGEAVNKVLHSTFPCKMHGCGREDMNVRCLGNGRPFILEVPNYELDVTEDRLNQIVDLINTRQGLNVDGDIEVTWLKRSDKVIWEGMQEVAEEKKKSYCCLIWSEKAIDKTQCRQLENSSSINGNDIDEDGRPCLKIAQKTPLRVLHRRSLLTRPKYIYDIEMDVLNSHYLIMKLTTSSGAYVKEFVHGDLGRTSPSISSIFGCQVDILQLDVIGLYDEFEGGLSI